MLIVGEVSKWAGELIEIIEEKVDVVGWLLLHSAWIFFIMGKINRNINIIILLNFGEEPPNKWNPKIIIFIKT